MENQPLSSEEAAIRRNLKIVAAQDTLRDSLRSLFRELIGSLGGLELANHNGLRLRKSGQERPVATSATIHPSLDLRNTYCLAPPSSLHEGTADGKINTDSVRQSTIKVLCTAYTLTQLLTGSVTKKSLFDQIREPANRLRQTEKQSWASLGRMSVGKFLSHEFSQTLIMGKAKFEKDVLLDNPWQSDLSNPAREETVFPGSPPDTIATTQAGFHESRSLNSTASTSKIIPYMA
jgi:hypothetical protein